MGSTHKTQPDRDVLLSLIRPLLGNSFDPSDLPEVAEGLAANLALAGSLDEIDLWEIEPAFKFDPTWDE
jgi:hypothetical protein